MTFKLSIAQAPAELVGSAARLSWLNNNLPRVTANQVDLLLLPELFVSGYNIGETLGKSAETKNGPAAQAIMEMARANSIAITYGFAERAGDLIYNAALCIGPRGDILGHHLKLAIPPGFERSVFTAGRGCQIFEYQGIKIAILICYDAEFAETVRHVSNLGAQLVLVPTALGTKWNWVAQTMIPTRAYENGVYLAYANSAGVENGFAFLGKSVVAAPNGVEIARAGVEPEFIYANIEKDVVAAAQERLPYLRDRSQIDLG